MEFLELSSRECPQEISSRTIRFHLGIADDVELDSAEHILALHSMYPGIEKAYHVQRVIGTGAFSSVFKAIDLNYHKYDNSGWEHSLSRRYNTRLAYSEPKIVAIKQIYATASPRRIYREIEILYNVRETCCPQILSIITCIRHQDQVLIVLPYAQHADFSDFFEDYPLLEIAGYLRDLLSACHAIHQIGLIHRDIKPNNYCWNPYTRKGVLVDFGLAQWQEAIEVNQMTCDCMSEEVHSTYFEKENVQWIHDTKLKTPPNGYRLRERRPNKRAERGGTRGFRAPEVLFRCPNQTTSIDIWSVGIILFCFLTQIFPFFHAEDDTDALVEMTSIFGIEEMSVCAARHTCILDTAIPHLQRRRVSWRCLVQTLSPGGLIEGKHPLLTTDDVVRCQDAFDFLDGALNLDPFARLTAGELLEHRFLNMN